MKTNSQEKMRKATERLQKDVAEHERMVKSKKVADFGSETLIAIYDQNADRVGGDVDLFGLMTDALARGFMAGYRHAKRNRRK